jgi:hypothetical protein
MMEYWETYCITYHSISFFLFKLCGLCVLCG